MSKPRVLLTGDDGYQSLGTRLLTHCLRDRFDLKIVGTASQQSAVGGKISLNKGFDWGITHVEGIETLWVDGTPCDAIEVASVYFTEPFDLVISGINWGANIGSGVFGSGTFNAALRAIHTGLSKNAIAMSWDLPVKYYLIDHSLERELGEYLEYPGKCVEPLVEMVLENTFWGADLVNINFPQSPTNLVQFTHMTTDLKKLYDYSEVSLPEGGGHMDYTGDRLFDKGLPTDADARALTEKSISLTLCRADVFDAVNFAKLNQKSLELKLA